jgi:hypothetical protein
MDKSDEILTNLLDLRATMDVGFQRLGTRMYGLETRMDGLETRMNSMETRFGHFEVKVMHRFDAIDRRLVAVEPPVSPSA